MITKNYVTSIYNLYTENFEDSRSKHDDIRR